MFPEWRRTLGEHTESWCRTPGKCVESHPISHLTSLVASGDPADYWIGLSDRLSENEWKWEDGSSLHYKNWAEGEEIMNKRAIALHTCCCNKRQFTTLYELFR